MEYVPWEMNSRGFGDTNSAPWSTREEPSVNCANIERGGALGRNRVPPKFPDKPDGEQVPNAFSRPRRTGVSELGHTLSRRIPRVTHSWLGTNSTSVPIALWLTDCETV